MVAEIEGVGLDNDQKKVIKNSLQKSIDSHIYLNTAQAIAAEANARFSNENIKTIEGQLQLWSKQDIAESEARIGEIIAKIPSEKQQYYVSKAHEEALKASKLLTEAAAGKTDEERKVLAIQQHVLFKEVDKMVAEIEGVGLDNDQKKIIKNSLQKSIDSQIYLNTAQAIAAQANANFSNENIKTIEGQLQLCASYRDWEGQRENVRRQIEEQVKQWAQENMFEGKKVSLEKTRTIADIILRSLESVQKIGQIVGTAMVR